MFKRQFPTGVFLIEFVQTTLHCYIKVDNVEVMTRMFALHLPYESWNDIANIDNIDLQPSV